MSRKPGKTEALLRHDVNKVETSVKYPQGDKVVDCDSDDQVIV